MLFCEGLLEPEVYDDLVYKFKKPVGMSVFSHQFRKTIIYYKRVGCNLNVMRQYTCLVFNQVIVNCYAFFFTCSPVGRASFFIYFYLLLLQLLFYFYMLLLHLVLCRVASLKSLPVHHS